MSNSMEDSQSSLDLQKQIKPRSNDPLLEGRKVRVRRSNSQLEDGFTITFFDQEIGKYVVQKNLAENKAVSKKVLIRELEALNPPKQ